MLFATKCLLIQHFNCLDYFPMTSIYLCCEYHYWACLGTWPLYLYYISRYVQVVSLSTNSLLVCISEELYVLSYPHQRIVGDGPLQRVTLYVSVFNQHCDVTSVSVVPCPFLLIMVVWFFLISWRSMAVIFGSTLGGLSGWTPALYILVYLYYQ